MDVQYAQSYGQPPPAYAPRYVMLSEANSAGLQAPPGGRRHLPRYYSRKHRDSTCSCGCLCWCCCFVLLIILAIAAAFAYTYVTLDPKPPGYKFKHMGVTAFDVRPDLTLHTEFTITVEAENPNKNIAIYYGKESMVAVLYRGAMLGSGKLPEFYQGHQNTTTFDVVLKGDSTFGSGLQEALTHNKQSNSIPLDVYIKVPVVLKAWTMETTQITVFVNCDLVVDSLSPHKKVGIKSAKYKVNVKF